MFEYYSDKTIFFTGGTGFLGTATLCRLLSQTHCPKRIFVLCRGGHKRAEEIWDSLLPASLVSLLVQNPRLTVIDGDITVEKFGISGSVLDELRETVDLCIHAASSINLQSPLQKMARSVVAPSLELAELALTFKCLQRFVFVSTAYSNSYLWSTTAAPDVHIDESIHELHEGGNSASNALAAWNEIQTTGTCSEYDSADFPFAYAYAKHLVERLLMHKFSQHGVAESLLVIRPSIIGPAVEYPYPGFSSPASTPSTVLAASLVLHPGYHMVISARCQNPLEEVTIDEVPVDVVADRLLTHVRFGTAGCIHAVRGPHERFSFGSAWPSCMKQRRIPWGLRLAWKPWDWKSPKQHPSARLFKVLGASFAFSQDRTEKINEMLGEKERDCLRLFVPEGEIYSLESRKDDIRRMAMAIGKKKGWPLFLVKMVCPKVSGDNRPSKGQMA